MLSGEIAPKNNHYYYYYYNLVTSRKYQIGFHLLNTIHVFLKIFNKDEEPQRYVLLLNFGLYFIYINVLLFQLQNQQRKNLLFMSISLHVRTVTLALSATLMLYLKPTQILKLK